MSARRLPGFVVPVAVLLAVLAVVYGRFIIDGAGAVRAARVAVGTGDRDEAIRCYLDALRAYVPGSPFERQALDGLEGLAADADRAGDREQEHRALQAIRSGLLGTRSVFIPHRSRLAQAEQRLVTLDRIDRTDRMDRFPPTTRGIAIETTATPFLRRLNRPAGPAVLWTVVALLGLALWVGAVVALIRRGVEPRPPSAGRTLTLLLGDGRAARVLLPALFVLGFGLFLAGLRFS